MKTLYTMMSITAALLAVPVEARVVPAWTASPQRPWGRDFVLPTNIPASLGNKTMRQVVRLGIGGRDVRVVLSNAYGTQPVTIEGAHLASSAGGSRIVRASDRELFFGGAKSVTIAPGATVASDAVPIAVRSGSDLAISLHFAQAPMIASFHWDGRRTGYLVDGDQLGTPAPHATETTTARLFISALLVDAPDARGTVVVLGDSITDGAGATLDAETRWPDYLAARAAPEGIAVVNAGISGARLLSDGMGSNALARFDRDVLAQPSARTLLLLLGTNDIAWPGTPFDPNAPPVTFETLVAGYKLLVARAHASGIRVIVGTLPPFANALPATPLAPTYYSASKDALRGRVNDWMRTSETFDGIVDFDRLLVDPMVPNHLALRFDSGDHLHPGDAGNKAMAEAVRLDTLIKEQP